MERKRTGNEQRSPLKLLIASGLLALLFVLAGVVLFYSNSQSLKSANQWVEHTEEVLEALHQANFLTEKLQGAAQLYAANREPAIIRDAEGNTKALQAAAFQIGILVSDNARQSANVSQLSICSASLALTISDAPPDVSASLSSIEMCQEVLARMAQQEQDLLKLRRQRALHGSYAVTVISASFAFVSLVIMSAMFVMLARDSLSRAELGTAAVHANEALQRSVQALEHNVAEAELLSAYRDDLQLCVELSQVYASAGQFIARLVPGCSGTLCIINNSRNLLEEVLRWGDGGNEETTDIAVFHPNACCGLRSGMPRWRYPDKTAIHCAHFEGPPPSRYLCIPMSAQGETLGVLHIACEDELVYLTLQQRLSGMREVVQLTAISLAAITLRSKLEHQSLRDPLTNLFNRHFMEVVLNRELLRAQRRRTSLAVLMLDIDHFKQFNDQYGHAAGDAMLQGVAKLFQTNVRGEDTICRYGGEEFVIILPDIEAQIAFRRAELIRNAIANAVVALPNGIVGRATLSIGLAFYPTDGETIEALLSKADQALYNSKRNGRNQVSLADHSQIGHTSG